MPGVETSVESSTYEDAPPPASRRRRHRHWHRVGTLVLIALVLAPLTDASGFYVSVGTHTFLNAAMALSLTLVYGLGGLVSLAQVGFGALAAYLVILGTAEGYPLPLLFGCGVLAAVVLAVLVGLPVVRLSGIYFLTATFAATEILRLVALNWTTVTGGQIGPIVAYDGEGRLPGSAAFVPVLGPDVADYVVAGLVFGVGAWVVWAFRSSLHGRRLMALRDNEPVATALGMAANRERLLAFAVSAAMAAVGGIYLAYFNGIVDPTAMAIMRSVDLLIIVIVGGVYYIRGALVGAVVVTVVPELLQISVEYRPILYGALLVIFATKLRQGVVGELRQLLERKRGRSGPSTSEEVTVHG